MQALRLWSVRHASALKRVYDAFARCDGVRPDGACEVYPAMRCVWIEAIEGQKRINSPAWWPMSASTRIGRSTLSPTP